MGETRLAVDGLGFPESTRWHDGRVWVCNWGTGEVLAVTTEGQREVMTRLDPQTLPFSIDWSPDGRLLIVDGPRRLLLRQQPDGSQEEVADLTGFSSGPFNELVVDAGGNAYVNGGSGMVMCVRPDGGVDQVADGLKWPNGMAVIDDGRTLLGTVPVDRGCFACMLGGEDGHTLFIAAAEWRGMDTAMREGPGITGQLLAAPGQPAPHAGHP